MEQKPGSLSGKIPFETLIKGPYREDFQKKVEEILRKRFRQLEKSRREGSNGEATNRAEAREMAGGREARRDFARPSGEKDTARSEARRAAAQDAKAARGAGDMPATRDPDGRNPMDAARETGRFRGADGSRRADGFRSTGQFRSADGFQSPDGPRGAAAPREMFRGDAAAEDVTSRDLSAASGGGDAFISENDTIRDEIRRQAMEVEAPSSAGTALPEGAEEPVIQESAGQTLAESLLDEYPTSPETGDETGTPGKAGASIGPGEPGGTDRRYERILRSAREAKRAYPQFQLRQELGSRRFAELLFRGVDAKTAYEAVHHDEMLRAAMGYGVKRASEKLSRARMERPAENGSESQSVAVSRRDPARLSPEEREDIRRRVLERGERVRF